MSGIAPNKCPNCGSPAYVGLNAVECTSPSCDHYHKQTSIDWALEMSTEWNEKQVEAPLETEEEPSAGAALKRFFVVDDGTGIDWSNLVPVHGGGDTEEDDIDEEADTTPGTLAWCQDLEADLKEVMRPLGRLSVTRELEYDGIRMTLYNPPTDCYVSEAFDMGLLNTLGDGVVDWLESQLLWKFPRELSRAWTG